MFKVFLILNLTSHRCYHYITHILCCGLTTKDACVIIFINTYHISFSFVKVFRQTQTLPGSLQSLPRSLPIPIPFATQTTISLVCSLITNLKRFRKWYLWYSFKSRRTRNTIMFLMSNYRKLKGVRYYLDKCPRPSFNGILLCPPEQKSY